MGPEGGRLSALWHTHIDIQLYHYVWNRSETEQELFGRKMPPPFGQRGPVHKGIQAVRNDFFCLSKVSNIRCFILIKCSEQKAMFKKICYSVVISEKNSIVCW